MEGGRRMTNMNCIHATNGVCQTCLAATHHTHAEAIEAGTQALVDQFGSRAFEPAMTDRTKDDGMTAEQMAPSALDLARKILADGVRDKVSLDTETGGDAVTVYIGRWMHLDAAGALALAKALTTLQQEKAALEAELNDCRFRCHQWEAASAYTSPELTQLLGAARADNRRLREALGMAQEWLRNASDADEWPGYAALLLAIDAAITEDR
jgi:hypothetical protein